MEIKLKNQKFMLLMLLSGFKLSILGFYGQRTNRLDHPRSMKLKVENDENEVKREKKVELLRLPTQIGKSPH